MANAIFVKHAILTRKRFKYLFRLHSMGIFFENIPDNIPDNIPENIPLFENTLEILKKEFK